jgi:hypothetical protein
MVAADPDSSRLGRQPYQGHLFLVVDRRLAGRRGKKRALVALAHTILVVVYHVIKEKVDYVELGANYLDELEPERLTRYLVKRLERRGHRVTLEPNRDAA